MDTKQIPVEGECLKLYNECIKIIHDANCVFVARQGHFSLVKEGGRYGISVAAVFARGDGACCGQTQLSSFQQINCVKEYAPLEEPSKAFWKLLPILPQHLIAATQHMVGTVAGGQNTTVLPFLLEAGFKVYHTFTGNYGNTINLVGVGQRRDKPKGTAQVPYPVYEWPLTYQAPDAYRSRPQQPISRAA